VREGAALALAPSYFSGVLPSGLSVAEEAGTEEESAAVSEEDEAGAATGAELLEEVSAEASSGRL